MSVFITGASSGIGEACARAFAAAGKDLVLVARRLDRLQTLRAEIAAMHGVQVDIFELDVSSRAKVDALAKSQAEIFDRVDVLINNAGLARGREPLHQDSPEGWDEMIDTNLKGLLYITHAFLPGFVKRGRGHVVNMGSVAGYWTYPSGGVYCATKYAVRALTETLRQDLHGTGVRVTEIAPGMVKTDFSRVRFPGDEKRAQAVYEGVESLSPKDIAETVLWCVQRPAHVNIQELVIFPTAQASVTMIARK